MSTIKNISSDSCQDISRAMFLVTAIVLYGDSQAVVNIVEDHMATVNLFRARKLELV